MTGRGSNVEGVRRANLGAILRLVHHEGSISRAALTQRTGLNRSTVGDLVATLADGGLVEERDPDPTRRVGRPSPTVVPSGGVIGIAVNPEVDALEVGAVALGGTVRLRVRQEVDHVLSPDETVSRVAAVVEEWQKGALREARILSVGVAVPGLVRASDGIVRNAPHLGWRDVDLTGAVQRETGLVTDVGNDASLGAVAEWLFGAARDHSDVVYLNGGASGIGGGVILRGASIGGSDGYAGEWGQNQPSLGVDSDRRVPGGVLEDEVNRGRLLAAVGLPGGDDDALSGALAAASDEVAAEVDRQRRILQSTLANAANVLNPSMIVLGGFLADLRGTDAEAFDGGVRAQMLDAPAEQLTVSAAALGRDRLLIGAAERVFERLVADPLG
ncbi:ROK family transcriptional regulator [Microbacterium halotolerans]|uniref:ROK family transcriptional regulator n=1 Tax=Microbacterium halotolerans TaxID=246613 RepID=UPI000E6AD06B|nr:ROK family transcriptional regulator [Microbacterium halotolerans]